MPRKDKGIRRSQRSPDRVFSFKLNPDNDVEGQIIDSLDYYRGKHPDVSLRDIIVDVFSRVEYRPPTREEAVLEIQDKMQEQIERLVGIIDKLMASGATLRSNDRNTAAQYQDSDDDLDLDYLSQIKSTLKRS